MNQNDSGLTLPGNQRSQQQTAGDVTVSGNENPLAWVTATGNAAIDQSRHIIYNYYYYRDEARVVPIAADDPQTEALPCPYRGLFHFGPEDAEFFFGREVFVQELVQATQTHNLIPVIGASGSGKSSVVFAGLIPKLQQQGHWQFTYFRPGAIRTKEGRSIVDPFYALATALVPLYEPNLNTTAQLAQASELAEYLRGGKVLLSDVITKIQHNYPQHRLLVIADQFEELYTLCQDEALRRQFLDILLDSISSPLASGKSPLVLVTTIRIDFLGNTLSYPAFADVMRQHQIQIRSMNCEELAQVIEKPAQKLGVRFETGLVERILDEVEDEPGNLPLLEFALTSLWSKRQGNQLTHKAYEEIGEVKGALTKYAEEKYSELSPEQQEQVRRIFVQLVRPGEGTEDTRRLATKDELGEARWSLVTELADKRLVVTSRNAAEQETVEMVHEALIRNWSQLREWMAKDRLFRAWQERLRAAMHQWEETQRDEGALLRGVSLAEAEEKLKERREELSPAEQNFIQQSIELCDRLRREEKARRQRGIVGGSVAVLAVITTLGGTAWYQSKQAALNSAKVKYYSYGSVAAEQGDNKTALYYYEQALHLDPKDAHTYYGLGSILYSLGDKKGALADYNQALHFEPNSADVYIYRGIVRDDLGDKKGALADYNQALRLNPNYAKAYDNRGYVRYKLGDKKGALVDYNQALHLAPSYAKAYANRGYVRYKLGDKKGALADYNQALSFDPKNAKAYDSRGDIRHKLGDKKGALADFNQALRLDPKNAIAYKNRGDVRDDLGDKKGALVDYNQALRLAPNYAKAYDNRERVLRELGDK